MKSENKVLDAWKGVKIMLELALSCMRAVKVCAWLKSWHEGGIHSLAVNFRGSVWAVQPLGFFLEFKGSDAKGNYVNSEAINVNFSSIFQGPHPHPLESLMNLHRRGLIVLATVVS